MAITRRHGLALSLGLFGTGIAAAQQAPLGERLADVVQGNNPQVFPRFRTNHAKGELFDGSFTATREAAALTRAPHMQGTPVPMLIRFSNAGGIPTAPDNAPSAGIRAMAMTFRLPDGSGTDLICISQPLFPVATPEDFIALNQAGQASRPPAPSPTPIQLFLGSHPAALRFVQAPKPMPVSFATQPYFAIHAFRFTNAAGETHAIRYRIIPEGGAQFVTAEQAAATAPNHLREEMRSRVAQGPALFRLEAQVAEPGDPTNDSTIAWPDSRRIVVLGQIRVTRDVPDSEIAERPIGFLPTNLAPGIALSDDPLIQARTDSYVVAYRRRNP